MKKLLIILASLLLLFVLACAGLIYAVMGRPEYSLWQFKKAYDTHDAATAQQYINIEALSTQIVDTVFTKAETVFGGLLGDGLGAAMLPAAKAKLQDQIAAQITAELSDETAEPLFEPIKNITLQDVLKRKVVNCEPTDNTATCTLASADGPIVLQMKQINHSTWQIVGIDNLNDMLNQRLNELMPGLTEQIPDTEDSEKNTNSPSGFISATTRAKDTKKISDLKQLQTAAELYYNAEGQYPTATSWTELGQLLKPYLSNIPTPPTGGDDYVYYVSADQTAYVFGTSLDLTNAVLDSDDDTTYDTAWSNRPPISATGNHPTEVDCDDIAKMYCETSETFN